MERADDSAIRVVSAKALAIPTINPYPVRATASRETIFMRKGGFDSHSLTECWCEGSRGRYTVIVPAAITAG